VSVPILKKLKNLRDNIRYLQNNRLKDVRELSFEELLYFRRYAMSLPGMRLPQVRTLEETVAMLCDTGKSIARYGDGEIFLMRNEGIPFQKADPALARRLREVLRNPPDDCEIGVGRTYWYYDKRVLPYVRSFALKMMSEYGDFVEEHLDYDRTYYDTFASQFHQTMTGVDFADLYARYRSIWRGRDILVVCGENAMTGLAHNLYDTASSIEYVYGPSRDAWFSYDVLLNQVRGKAAGRLVLLMLGPTATVMAADLAREGIRALDIGHLAKDYDAFRRDAPVRVEEAATWFGT